MTQQEIAKRLQIGNNPYKGKLTSYAVKSIVEGKSNYPVSNLLQYCNDMNIVITMLDETTEDKFYPKTILEVHWILNLLMDRYEVDPKLVYRKTGIYYTPPKTFEQEELDKLKSQGVRFAAPLSIKTLLAVCEVIHCNLLFESK